MNRAAIYRFEWWRLSFRHTYVDEGNRIWRYSPKIGMPPNPNPPPPRMKSEAMDWLESSIRPLGSLGVERAYELIPPSEKTYGTFDGPRTHYSPGQIRFARKADLMLFKMSM